VVVDKGRVENRIDRIRRYKRDLRDFSNISREAFRGNRERQYAVLHAMQNAIEACLEIASHIVSADKLGAPRDYASLFTILEQHQILPTPVADKMRQMARFHNRIVHLYWDIDLDLIYAYLMQRLEDFEHYLAHIEIYLGPRV
jgi:uncharacterized protein YutE (UPF0331/DUF86 family)